MNVIVNKEGQLRWFTSFFDKRSTGSGTKNKTKQNQQLANDLHKPFIRKIKRK